LLRFELSDGTRKRVGLVRALVMELELILFDEPTQGLDPVIGALIDEQIINLTERTKTTSIIVTHLTDSAFHGATVWPCCTAERLSNRERPGTCGNRRTLWRFSF
jgi:ABC-type transporter Mla maintaining outer membrane lipid asymmetry ATPase subunit MlaF